MRDQDRGFQHDPHLDLTVDGADEIDHQLNLVKGGGGALLREKIVAMASDRVCIIADSSKYVPQLGAFPLPIEIVDFGLAATIEMIKTAADDAGCAGEIKLRKASSGEFYRTDGGHLIADCAFGAIPDVETLTEMLDVVPGVVEHGLFLCIADDVFLAGADGVKHFRPSATKTTTTEQKFLVCLRMPLPRWGLLQRTRMRVASRHAALLAIPRVPRLLPDSECGLRRKGS